MKKRFLTLIMAGIMAMSLMVGCGSDNTETTGNNVSNGVESNDNTTVNNDTDSSAESDTTKEDTQKIEYSKDDVIIEIAGASFSIYDTWENIEPVLQNESIQIVDEYGSLYIKFADKEAEDLNVEFFLWETEDSTYIKRIKFAEWAGNEMGRDLIKMNGYSLNSVEDMANDYELEIIENGYRVKGYITEEVSVLIDDSESAISGDITREDLKR